MRKEPDLRVEEETLRNRSGPEVEAWRTRVKGTIRAGMGTGTGEGRMEHELGDMED